MSKTAQLKQAFIKQAHPQNKMITLAIFVKELEDELEVANWIATNYAHEYEQHIQMHMKNMLEAQLKLNAGADCIMRELLKHVEELAEHLGADTVRTHSIDEQAEQATKDLLNKLRLH